LSQSITISLDENVAPTSARYARVSSGRSSGFSAAKRRERRAESSGSGMI
jgi:hypothetical protein